MKKNFLYAGALAVLFASCSNEDGLSPQVGPEQAGSGVVNELKISLVSGTGPTTRTSNGTGAENTLHGAFVFVKADVDGPDATTQAYEYKYIAVELKSGQTTTVVKHVQANSKVYVLANSNFFTKLSADEFAVEVNKKVGAEDAEFQKLLTPVVKSYVSGLETTNGRFIMSGVATVPTLSTTGATVLDISVKRDLAKVSFKVNKVSTETTTRIKTVEEITIRRSANDVQPFAMSGTTHTTYVLPYGFGDLLYNQDGLKGDVLTPDNDQQTQDATDFTFVYKDKDVITGADDFTFSNFYVLPNAANVAEKGTIIVLKAKIEKSTTTDGTTNWTEVQGSKYYKARISSGIDAYNTAKNSSYSIVATIKGEGNDTEAGPGSPDAENTESDLNINVLVEPWSLVVSNQEIE